MIIGLLMYLSWFMLAAKVVKQGFKVGAHFNSPPSLATGID
jgi:hypothetical protein